MKNIHHLDINQKLNFTEQLLKKYDFDYIYKEKLLEQIGIIRNKINDKNLYLAVIGEFSCGKSSFINALLRENLLETSVIQGTTVINTEIRYSSEYNLIIEYNDGKTLNLKSSKKRRFLFFKPRNLTLSDIKDKMNNASNDEKTAQGIRKMTIEFPADFLKQGIVIVDTPGINSTTRWHEDVTKYALENIADASIILTDASRPMPETLKKFILETMNDILEHTLCIVTKFDSIRPRERNRLLESIRQNITNSFHSAFDVIPYTALYILSSAGKEDINILNENEQSDYDNLLSQSYATEEKIYSYLKSHRQLIQTYRTDTMLDSLLNEMSVYMEKQKKDYENEHYSLINNPIVDLKHYIDMWLERSKEEYYNSAKTTSIIDKLWQDIANIHQDTISTISHKIYEFDNTDSIKNFCSNDINTILSKEREDISIIFSSALDELNRYANDISNTFWIDFQEHYNGLNSLYQASENRFRGKELSINHRLKTDVKSMVKDFNSDQKSVGETGGTVGGLIGTVIGTFIFPGLGSIIGGAIGGGIGGFLEALFAPDLNDLKSKIWNEVYTKMEEEFNTLCTKTLPDILIEHYTKAADQISKNMNECYEKYQLIITEAIELDKIRADRLTELLMQLKDDECVIRQMLNT